MFASVEMFAGEMGVSELLLRSVLHTVSSHWNLDYNHISGRLKAGIARFTNLEYVARSFRSPEPLFKWVPAQWSGCLYLSLALDAVAGLSA